jgi:hypothetical protein
MKFSGFWYKPSREFKALLIMQQKKNANITPSIKKVQPLLRAGIA